MSSAAEQWRAKRRRRQQEDEDDEEDNPFKEFDMKSSSSGMTAAKRLRMEREQALQMMTGAAKNEGAGGARMRAAKHISAIQSFWLTDMKLVDLVSYLLLSFHREVEWMVGRSLYV